MSSFGNFGLLSKQSVVCLPWFDVFPLVFLCQIEQSQCVLRSNTKDGFQTHFLPHLSLCIAGYLAEVNPKDSVQSKSSNCWWSFIKIGFMKEDHMFCYNFAIFNNCTYADAFVVYIFAQPALSIIYFNFNLQQVFLLLLLQKFLLKEMRTSLQAEILTFLAFSINFVPIAEEG